MKTMFKSILNLVKRLQHEPESDVFLQAKQEVACKQAIDKLEAELIRIYDNVVLSQEQIEDTIKKTAQLKASNKQRLEYLKNKTVEDYIAEARARRDAQS